jgi:hypothetical protein
MRNHIKHLLYIMVGITISACSTATKEPKAGTYEFDRLFLEKHQIEHLELMTLDGNSGILIVPAYQGRVMTSTSGGSEGRSYGWINYALIESGKTDPQFNPLGGEERFWLGPEGGPYSIYFPEGKDQVFENWQVPSVIDTEAWEIKTSSRETAKFVKETSLTNASGTVFNLGIERTVSLLTKDEVSGVLGVEIPEDLQLVAYQSNNVVTNQGTQSWTKEGGLLSIWILSMFNPTPETTVFIPYNPEGESTIVNDEYFGKVPADRLIAEEGMIYFKADGQFRSKIGIPPGRAKELCGSYDPERNVLTLVWYSLPGEPGIYVNSNWGDQDDPFDGDVVNSYNDGPLEDGSIMGPFYELETSSPAMELEPSGSASHMQRVMHFEGNKDSLNKLVNALFSIELQDITNKFQH